MARAEKVELPASRIGIRYAVLLSYERIWSAFGDSNSGLPHYKSGVLPTELKTQTCGAQSETRTRKPWWAPAPETGVSTVPPSVHMAPDGGVDPHGLSATHGFQDRCQRRLTSSGIFVVRKARFELACPFGYRILSAVRLPVPPLVHMVLYRVRSCDIRINFPLLFRLS